MSQQKQHEDLGLLKNSYTKEQVYFVSAVSAGCEVEEKMLLSIRNFCNTHNAKPVILGMRKHTKALKQQPHFYDPKIENILGKCLCRGIHFNSNLYAVDAQINPQQINPLTGLSRYRHQGKQKSLIVASPKICLETKAVGNNKHPRLVLTTGAINRPEYQYNRTGMLAKQMHKVAGLVIHVLDDKFFILRHVEFDDAGNFIDLGSKYTHKQVLKVKAEAMVLGDLHAENISAKALKTTIEQLHFFKPSYTILHDIISFNSISHHNTHNILEQQRVLRQFPSVKHEINSVKKVLKILEHYSKQICCVSSNHHDHLEQWIKEGRYQKDVVNFEIGSKLALIALKGRNVCQAILDPLDKYVWWDVNDDYYIKGIHVSSHGHKGSNGMRGSPKLLSDILGKCVCGHTHQPRISEDYMSGGTNSELDLGYNKGASSWLQANVVIYENGSRQLLISIPETTIWR